jgi:hypothetical protein
MSLKEKFLSWLGSFADDEIRSATDRYEETRAPKLPPGAVVLSRPEKEYAAGFKEDICDTGVHPWLSISSVNASMRHRVIDVGPLFKPPDLKM